MIVYNKTENYGQILYCSALDVMSESCIYAYRFLPFFFFGVCLFVCLLVCFVFVSVIEFSVCPQKSSRQEEKST